MHDRPVADADSLARSLALLAAIGSLTAVAGASYDIEYSAYEKGEVVWAWPADSGRFWMLRSPGTIASIDISTGKTSEEREAPMALECLGA